MFAKSLTTRVRRLLMVLSTLGLAAGWAAAPVGAQQSPPSANNFTAVLSICPSFDVQVDVHGKQGVLTLPNNMMIITSPALKATVTNLENSKSVNLNITGSTHLDTSTGLQVFVGSNLILRSQAFGDTTEALAYVNGRYTFPPFSGVGTYTDLCVLLA